MVFKNLNENNQWFIICTIPEIAICFKYIYKHIIKKQDLNKSVMKLHTTMLMLNDQFVEYLLLPVVQRILNMKQVILKKYIKFSKIYVPYLSFV